MTRLQDATYVLSSILGATAGAALHAASRLLHAGAGTVTTVSTPLTLDEVENLPEQSLVAPSRAEQLERLKDPKANFDVIVIGGGATGSGAGLDAAGRGLKVALLEAGDFASQTSSKSTKLIHGGVRYLETAVKKLDRGEYDLVQEGLKERKSFLHMAPHLTGELRLVTPCYKTWDIPFYFAGLTLYDWIAGRENLGATRILSAKTTAELAKGVRTEGLKGGIAYSDGQFNDARMNVGLATTAATQGAVVANYVAVKSLIKEDGKVVGVQVEDKRSGETWPVRGKVVINATGPFIDSIRHMDDAKAPNLVAPSAGTHIVVNNLGDLKEGILVPKAPNGSVAFFRPFEGDTLIGTTEEKTDVQNDPGTTADQVEYLRQLGNQYLDEAHQIQPENIKAVWTGIRPLVRDPKHAGEDSVKLSRSHIIDVSDSGLVTIGGGKWTSFGRMGQEVVDAAVQEAHLPFEPSHRNTTQLIGAQGFSPALAGQLAAKFGLDADVADHLAHNYGDRAIQVARLAEKDGLRQRLAPGHPYIEAEVVYSAQHEYAQTPVDVLSRRTRLSFIDEKATMASLPRVTELMARTLGWTPQQAAAELQRSQEFYSHNGLTGVK